MHKEKNESCKVSLYRKKRRGDKQEEKSDLKKVWECANSVQNSVLKQYVLQEGNWWHVVRDLFKDEIQEEDVRTSCCLGWISEWGLRWLS